MELPNAIGAYRRPRGAPVPVAPTPTPPPAKVLAEGNSIMAYSFASDGADSFFRVWASKHPAIASANYAVGGSQVSTMVARQGAASAYAPTHLFIEIGANDLGSDTAAYLAALYAYTDQFRAAGAKVIICTVLPRGVGGQSSTASGWEAKRGPYNTAIRAAKGTKIDDYVDFDITPLGFAGAESDATLFISSAPAMLHPTALGHTLLEKLAFGPVANFQLGIDNEPADFAFAPQAAATADTDYDSAAYTVKGFYRTESRPYAVQAGRAVSKNGGAFVTNGSGTVTNGDTVRVRNRSSAAAATQTDVTLTIGTTAATFSVTTAGAGSRDWVPTDLGSKLKLWLRPEGISGADDAVMATWPDSSGNSITVTGIGFGSAPHVKTNAINSLKAAKIASSYNQSGFTLPAGYLTGRTSGAAFFVSKQDTDPPANGFAPPLRDFGTDGSGEYYPFNNGSLYSSYGSTTRQQVTPYPSLAAWRIASFHSAASDWRYYVDGTLVFGTASNTFANGSSPRIAGGDQSDQQIAEIIDCTSSLTTTERQLVEGYLAWTYALAGNLPAGHPYKSAKPTI